MMHTKNTKPLPAAVASVWAALLLLSPLLFDAGLHLWQRGSLVLWPSRCVFLVRILFAERFGLLALPIAALVFWVVFRAWSRRSWLALFLASLVALPAALVFLYVAGWYGFATR